MVAGPSTSRAIQARPRSAVPAELAHAGFVSRAVAFVVDLVVIAVAVAGATWVLDTVDELLRPWSKADLSAFVSGLVFAFIPVVVIGYFVGSWKLTGQTIGKWLLGLRVVSIDGPKLRLGQALVRLVGYGVSAIPFYAGFLWVLVDPQRRALHDRLARTVVVYVAPPR